MEHDIATLVRAVAAAVPDRECYVQGDERVTFAAFAARADQVANLLHDRGLGCSRERADLAGHESGQDHLGLYLHNCRELLEANVGAFGARVAPFNVNYRYTAAELTSLLTSQRARVVVFHERFAPTVATIAPDLPDVALWLEVPDGSGAGLAPGAEWWAEALDPQPTSPPPVTPSPDDLYILCTGGTTGTPKGVLWRQADVFVAAFGGVAAGTRREFAEVQEVVDEAVGRGGWRNMPIAPFIHGAAQWTALTALTHGNTVVVPPDAAHLDPAAVWTTVERERVTLLQVVGDALARPLLDELDRGSYDISSLKVVANGGAILSAASKARLMAARPGLLITDGLGSSEAGPIATQVDRSKDGAAAGPAPVPVFALAPNGAVLSADLDAVLAPDDPSIGWVATTGRIPLGYFGDAERTARTFPVVDGVRWAVPGDRARHRPDGLVELLGRDSVTINTGGEKVYAEEVEQAILRHPAVQDVVVCGRPSERWGSEVVAVVALRPGAEATADDLRATAGEVLARYKLPKDVVFRPAVHRSPAGKADYAWARAQVTDPPT